MENIIGRPFYTKYAWAYDSIIKAPVSKRCDFVESIINKRGLLSDSTILDAGTGTGNYAINLAQRGYKVTGVDISKELILEARSKSKEIRNLSFEVGNILEPSLTSTFDLILCRGVLNDIIDDQNRKDIFDVFSRTLRNNGILIFDVRDWGATLLRKQNNPVFESSSQTDKGTLTFRSTTKFDEPNKILKIHECHTIEKGDTKDTTEYDFEMRCWTIDEVQEYLQNAGFDEFEFLGDYDFDVPMGSTDRIVVIANKNANNGDGADII